MTSSLQVGGARKSAAVLQHGPPLTLAHTHSHFPERARPRPSRDRQEMDPDSEMNMQTRQGEPADVYGGVTLYSCLPVCLTTPLCA